MPGKDFIGNLRVLDGDGDGEALPYIGAFQFGTFRGRSLAPSSSSILGVAKDPRIQNPYCFRDAFADFLQGDTLTAIQRIT